MTLSISEAAQNEGLLVLAVGWILIGIPGILVALRVYCKLMLSRGFGWDDGVCVFSWLLQIIFTVLVTKGVQMGVLGRHVEDIENQASIPHRLKLLYIGFVIIIFGCVFAKTSFVITLLRIVTQPWQKVTLWFILITMNVLMWLCGICYLAQCRPAAALWNTKLFAEAQCWPTYILENIAMVAGAYSGCMDFILAFFPWLIVWNLQMKKHEKFGIILAMSMGVFAAIAAFIKTSKLKNVAAITDFTYYCSPILLWASAETGLTIFASSIPALRILFVRMHSSSGDAESPRNYNASRKNQSTARSANNDDCASRISPYWSEQYYMMGGDIITLSKQRDDSSDKSILSISGIKQTREVTITYEASKGKVLGTRKGASRKNLGKVLYRG
ncbi:uncharacterized protein N7483_004283 [Penicillium malachiteum]|uniref:uncharacterized protein n=1 Tax=Penicillium malachiteum TaxID=1324776 RepID=UPI0025476B59|nr:uncharacterized protein N7483_004283 [Penicillium malachiteum]KAJ5729775.1 hypothetical protein N7483_004283 [Penicillium malachiteum]